MCLQYSGTVWSCVSYSTRSNPEPARTTKRKLAWRSPRWNIAAFLKALSNVWAFKSSDLFQTVDLYEAKNMTAVVDTLLQLRRKTEG
eukprot:g15270.t1